VFRRNYIESEAFRFWKVCYEDLFVWTCSLGYWIGNVNFWDGKRPANGIAVGER
jgi:hypothetical protein